MAFCKHNGGGPETCPACKREGSNSASLAGSTANNLSVAKIKDWFEEDVKQVFAEGTYSTNVAWLIDALDAANRRAQYWKDEHLAGNEEIGRLKAQLKAARGEALSVTESFKL